MGQAIRILTGVRGGVFAVAGVALVLLLVAGCAIKLAPNYDKTIVDGLTKANQDTLILFASVSSGTTAATFPDREATYNDLIGAFDALRIQANARPTPRPYVLQILGLGHAEDKQPQDIDVLQTPTPGILQQIVATLTRMRDNDEAKGLSAAIITGFKNSYETSIDQALTYEKALER